MKEISRKGFLKIAAATAMSGVTAGALAACDAASSSTAASSAAGAAVYTPGTYTAKATGMGEVTVTMTFTESAITEVTVDTANETIDLARDSAADFQQALLDAQSAEIDGVSGATFTSDAVKQAAASCIDQAMGIAVEQPAPSAPAQEVVNGYPACEELEGVNAAGQGEIAFVADAIPDSEIAETVEIDVLVCGQGPAGMAAALACAEQGMKVVALEKGASPTWRSATMGAFHDKVHEKYGVQFDTKEWLDDAMVNCAYRGEQSVYQKWIDTCDEAVNWFLDELELPLDDYRLTFNAGDFPDFTDAYDVLSLSRSWNTSINIPLATDQIAAKLQEQILKEYRKEEK